ncbi:MAG: hypothetical protein KFF49_08740, partial [Bacteroidales bacterium]|nr:hypothetical protein [Bacteroidales bacterium]
MIENYDMMDPFLMSIVSNSDHWMFISSTGGLTAGRRNPDVAIFPYYTDDKIHESHLTTGSKTVIISGAGDKRQIWEPFSDFQRGIYDVQCNLYKNVPGNRVVFEEINRDLELIYRYSWMNSEKYGWIRKSTLINQSERVVNVSLLDGLRNILPYGVSQKMQNELSTLVDAYKKTELDINTGLGIFRLASIPVDRAMPSEALKCTSVWFTGYKPLAVWLEEKQLKNFKMTGASRPEKSSKGVRGCYFTVADRELKAREELEAYYVVELEQDAADVEALVSLLGSNTDLPDMLDKDVDLGTKKLNQLVGMSDGIQQSADRMSNIRHFSNVLFNLMRGGLFENSYDIIRDHFAGHLEKYNRKLYAEYNKFLKNLPESISLDKLLEKVKEREDNRLLRLSMEYLPLSFSRRHGDPSRPWNRFDIRLKEDDGTPSYSYQGNWRDIFQNWEALALSFPGFLPSMISRFLNSSTADGHNPYRISSDGIDWEVPEPDNPWSYIGYWGDHQVIYLLRLLEMLYNYRPEQVDEWLDHRIFSYANIPYRIKKYDEIVENPYDTIVFDAGKNREIDKLTEIYGADGKMLMGEDGHVLMASFTEKIMVSLLSRIVNFIPDTGIWMNTQRPEWNDANNALVGNGASMVTLYYLRRMTGFLMKLFAGATNKNYKIRKEIVNLFNTLNKVLKRHSENLLEGIDDKLRKKISDDLGRAGTEYRESVYQGFSGDYGTLDRDELTGFLQIVSACIDSSIWNNRREDGLFNAYNLVDISGSSIKIITLEEMLEGQVAMLSSGLLTPAGAGELIERMFESKLYRADQNSFMLYPDKELKSFRSNNNIDREEISGSV